VSARRARSAAWRRERPRRVYLLVLAAFIGWSVLVLVTFDLAKSTYDGGTVSQRVQHHGIASPGSVVSVQNTRHGGVSVRGTGTWWTSSITVALSEPVDGTDTTTVSYPTYSPLRHGDTVNVLIDPRHLEYAELPGKPNVGSRNWLLAGALAAIFGVVELGLVLLLVLGLKWTGSDKPNPPSEGAETGSLEPPM
jgi:hypothetical protein